MPATETSRLVTIMSVKRSITWYPGHMRSALAALRRVIKGVDLVLEVRDSRVSSWSAAWLGHSHSLEMRPIRFVY